MRFYNRQHRHYCGIDLHVKTMYVCLLDATGQVLVHRKVPSTPEALLDVVDPYRDDRVVAAECMFTWYWLADVCAAEGIAFVLGHALAMKAIHGGKAKNDKLDSFKIASLLRGGLRPQADVYPAAMRATRDLIRRRLHLVRKRGQLLAHIQNTRAQYNLPAFGRRLAYPANRDGVREHFADARRSRSRSSPDLLRMNSNGPSMNEHVASIEDARNRPSISRNHQPRITTGKSIHPASGNTSSESSFECSQMGPTTVPDFVIRNE